MSRTDKAAELLQLPKYHHERNMKSVYYNKNIEDRKKNIKIKKIK